MSMDKVFGSFSSTPYEAMQDWFTTEFLPAYEQSGDTLNTDDWKAVVGLFQHYECVPLYRYDSNGRRIFRAPHHCTYCETYERIVTCSRDTHNQM